MLKVNGKNVAFAEIKEDMACDYSCENLSCLVREMFTEFVKHDKSDYKGWEKIKVFFAPSLSEAWILARPNDKMKFKKEAFKKMVDSGNGKWLEKQNQHDDYKIILATQDMSVLDICTTFCHEIRHCIDYMNAVSNLCFDEYRPGDRYFNNWSEFNAVNTSLKFEFFLTCQKPDDVYEGFLSLSSMLGRWSADCVEGLMWSESIEDKLYFLSRYIGVSRAVRNINIEKGYNIRSFHLWYITPTYITENFGDVFYIGNEFDSKKVCALSDENSPAYDNLVYNLMKKSSNDN